MVGMINELGVEETGLIKTVNGKPAARTTLKVGHQDLEGAGRPDSPPAPHRAGSPSRTSSHGKDTGGVQTGKEK